MTDFKTYIGKIANGDALTREEAQAAFDIMMSGEATAAQIGGFLMGLRVRGEKVSEIIGAVTAMRSRMLKVEAPDNAIDIVGTGGDALGTYNVSTCAAIVVAACGVPVAKHGNRAISSKSGAADALIELGVDLDIGPEKIAECIKGAGVGFMFAPAHHSAMRHVGPARAELGTRTIFNLLGPLSNPAGVKRQVIGVFKQSWLEPLTFVMQALGSERIWMVHGSDGMDELTTTGPTFVSELHDGHIKYFEVVPSDAGLETARPEDLRGGDAGENAAALSRVLDGEPGAYRDIVLLNSAASLMVADKAESLFEGAEIAAKAIDSGEAKAALERLVKISNA
ncbi:MAG: anthranilate phosphoribosyltransferase [Hyphomicrobiales bacterium]|nr:MAG: anthranilate phosphoribosyltransferase [Hyphomicrobiales bacterium]